MKQRAAVVIAIPTLAVLVYITGAYRYATPSALRDMVLGLGLLGPVVFAACFAVGVTVWVPSWVFLVGAAMTWPPIGAIGIAWIGAVVAGLPAFLLARYAARDWVQAHLGNRLQRVDRALERGGVRGVVLLRLIFFMHPALPPTLALSRVRLHQFVVGSVVGLLPGVILNVVFGVRVLEWVLRQPPQTWMVLGVGVVALALGIRTLRRRRAAALPPSVVPEPNAAEA